MEKKVINKQIGKSTGFYYHANLDAVSMQSLQESKKLHRHSHGDDFSTSVIIRRAVRMYLDHLKTLIDIEQERIECQRSAKGVL